MSTQHQQQQYQPHMSFAPPPPPGSLEATLSSSAHSHATHAYSPAAGGGVAGDDMAEQIRMHQQLMQQHELALTARNGRASFGSQGTRARGGPGYHEAGGMFGEVGDGSHIGGGGHRRSRSHGHVRGVKSEDLGGSAAGFMFGADASGGKISPSEVYGGGGGFFEGMLAPPHLQRSPSIPPSAHSHPSRSPSPSGSVHSLHSHASQHSLSAAASGVPGYNPHHPSPSPSNPLYYASSTAASNADSASPFQHRPFVPSHPHLGPQSTPFVYHSPVASPAPSAGVGEGGEGLSEYFVRGRQGSGGSVGSVGSGSGPVTTQSKTTPATIEAAMRRRNPGTEAKFVW